MRTELDRLSEINTAKRIGREEGRADTGSEIEGVLPDSTSYQRPSGMLLAAVDNDVENYSIIFSKNICLSER